MIGRVRIWGFHKTAAFVKSLSPPRNFVHGRVNLQDQRLFLQRGKDLLPVMPVPHGRQDAEMLNVKRVTDVPI